MKYFLILFALFFLISCNKNDVPPNELSKTLIGNGDLHGNGKENIEKQNFIIKSTEAWNQLINQLNSVNNESRNFTETEIDFAKYIVLAVFDEVKMNGGYSIDIIKVEELQNNVVVTILRLSPGSSVYTVITQPFYIVKIPVTEKPIIFRET